MSCQIRLATSADSTAILAVYAPYVGSTAASFETRAPSPEEFDRRVAGALRQYPYLVCLIDGQIVGYAYASRHRERAAYAYDADLSVYVVPGYHGQGIASRLYNCLIELLREMGVINLYAAIALPNPGSERLHLRCGFTPVGIHHQTGYKLGRWHDVLWMEKHLLSHLDAPGPVLTIGQLDPEYVRQVCNTYAQRS